MVALKHLLTSENGELKVVSLAEERLHSCLVSQARTGGVVACEIEHCGKTLLAQSNMMTVYSTRCNNGVVPGSRQRQTSVPETVPKEAVP